jgi:hypothetical protein
MLIFSDKFLIISDSSTDLCGIYQQRQLVAKQEKIDEEMAG